MANYKTQAINLKSYNLGETDKIMVMYSREHGIIRAVAKGVKKSTSKLGGRMQLFSSNNLMLAKGRNLDIVCQAENIDNFSKIRNDLDRMSYAFYCVELINHFGTENDPSSTQIYDILFETLKNISIFTTIEEILWAVMRFKLKLTEFIGYALELDNCETCNVHQGLCGECWQQSSKSVTIDKRHTKLFKDAINFDFPFEKEHGDKILLLSSFNILKEFISQRSDKKLKTPDIIQALC